MKRDSHRRVALGEDGLEACPRAAIPEPAVPTTTGKQRKMEGGQVCHSYTPRIRQAAPLEGGWLLSVDHPGRMFLEISPCEVPASDSTRGQERRVRLASSGVARGSPSVLRPQAAPHVASVRPWFASHTQLRKLASNASPPSNTKTCCFPLEGETSSVVEKGDRERRGHDFPGSPHIQWT